MQENKAKFKERKFRIENGCLRLFLVTLAFPILCWMSLWVFAHFGGEWVSSSAVPIPPDSRILEIDYDQGYSYVIRSILYENTTSPEELREWFIQHGMYMTPIPLDMEHTRFIDFETYYGFPVGYSSMSTLQEHHYFASTLTHGWWEDFLPTCQTIRVYKDASFAQTEYPNLQFSSRVSVFGVSVCWAAN
jgi:hypothetical protein